MTQGTTRSDTTRFPNGIATNEIQQNLGQFILPDPTKVYSVFDDFNEFGVGNSGSWNVTETQAGATQVITDADGGVLVLTNTATEDDLVQIQKSAETFLFESGKQIWFKSVFKVSESIQSDLAVGLQVINSDGTGAVTDGVFFRKADGDQTLQLIVVKDSVETVTDVLEMADDTYVTVGYYYDGYDKISIFSDNEGVGKSVITNMPDDEELALISVVKNGQAASKVLSIDYIFASKQR